MSQYKTGTATVTNGSATVTGTNTLWLANVTAGNSFTVAGDGVMYDVASVDSDTQITLSAPYAGTTASGVVYAIGTGFTVPDSFPEMSQGDIETATIFTRAIRKIQGKFSALVSDISGKAAIAGQVFTGDIAAPKITASTGVLFGADTAAANTLDDYEEGNWTPSVGGDATYTSQSGKYTKIGNQITIECVFAIDILGTGSASTLSGLPFLNSSLRGSGTINFFGDLALSPVILNLIILPNSTSVEARGSTSASPTIPGVDLFTDESSLQFSATYLV